MEVIWLKYEDWSADWFAALIRNARDNADELRRIDRHLKRTERVSRWPKWRLRLRITRHLLTAGPEPPPIDETERRLRESDWFLHDTTGYDDPDPETIVTFIPRLGRRQGIEPQQEDSD